MKTIGDAREYRDLLHQAEAECDRLWNMYDVASRRANAANEELDKVAYDYNKLAAELCREEEEAYNLEGERDAAAECVRLLIAWARADRRHWDADTMREETEAVRDKAAAWDALPIWLRREIEAG